MPLPHRLAVWLACAAPLVWIPGGMDRFVFGKLVLSAAMIACAAVGGRRGRLPRTVALAAGAGLLLFTVACLLSPTPVASFVGRWPRYEGLPVVLAYAGCAWAGARIFGRRTSGGAATLETGLAVASLLLAVFSALGSLGWHVEGASHGARAGSVLGNATDQGLVAMMFFAVLFGTAVAGRRPLVIAGAAAAPLAVVLSGSRAASFATVAVLVIHLVAAARSGPRRSGPGRRMYLAAGGSILAVAVLALALPQLRDRLTEGHSITARLLLWKESLQVGGHRWLLGGPSTFVDAVGRYRDTEWVREAGTRNPPDSPHSWPLQALVSGGVPLLLVAVAVAVIVLVLGWRAVRRDDDAIVLGLFAAVAGYGIALLPNFTIAGSTCLAAFLVGSLVAEPASRAEPPAVRWSVAAAAVAFGVLFVSSAAAERALEEGVVRAADGDSAGAEAAFDRAARLRPLDGDVAMIAAQAQAGLADQEVAGAAGRAESWARKSLARTPGTYASGLALAVAQIHQQRLPDALATLDPLVGRFPTEPGARIQRALARFGLGDVAGARRDLERARQLDRRDPVPRRLLARIDQLTAGRE